MKRAYYNEIDPYAAEWLRNLIHAGLIAPGDVDERSIVEVQPADLRGYTQCHFFAGIGGWSLALRAAGWSDERAVWTGSCPCQPFSSAGKQAGESDERHLWPEFLRLIAERRPPVVFGEQVASRLGRGWLSGVRADLEALGYGVGAADLCATGAGAPHIRQRLWWVADAGCGGFNGRAASAGCGEGAAAGVAECGAGGGAGHAEHEGLQRRGDEDVSGTGRRSEGGEPASAGGATRGIPNAGRTGLSEQCGQRLESAGSPPHGAGHWSNAVWISCADGKARRIEPGLEPLAHGVPNRVGRLRAYGNAIVPEVAEAFIRAYAGA